MKDFILENGVVQTTLYVLLTDLDSVIGGDIYELIVTKLYLSDDELKNLIIKICKNDYDLKEMKNHIDMYEGVDDKHTEYVNNLLKI